MIAYNNKDNTNFFMAVTRLEYNGSNKIELTDYIVKSLDGDYSITYIGNAKIKYTPKILEIDAVK